MPSFLKRAPVVPVIRLDGLIAARQGCLNAVETARMIERAFRRRRAVAVAVVINSPGGSPTQSSLIAAHIRRRAEETGLPVTAFVEDAAASGGYWLACAADDIIVDENAVLGSIGVISASFGFHEMIDRLGIERRVHTAGPSKSFLDPFRPEREEDVARLRRLQDRIHENFIAHVTSRRGERLMAEQELFNGDFWLGADAVGLGLADAVGHLIPVMKARHGEGVKFVHHGPRRGILRRFGLSMAAGLVSDIEERALWARYGM